MGCESTELNVFLCHSGFARRDNVDKKLLDLDFPLHKVWRRASLSAVEVSAER